MSQQCQNCQSPSGGKQVLNLNKNEGEKINRTDLTVCCQSPEHLITFCSKCSEEAELGGKLLMCHDSSSIPKYSDSVSGRDSLN